MAGIFRDGNLMVRLRKLFEIDTQEPHQDRRRKILNFLIFGVSLYAILILAPTIILAVFTKTQVGTQEQIVRIYWAALAFSVSLLIIYLINRYSSSFVASILFLILIIVAICLSDRPEEIAEGRKLLMFAIPIAVASLLLRPSSSFIMAAVSSLIIVIIALRGHNLPGIPSIAGFFLIALISWLSGSSLKRTLGDLYKSKRNVEEELGERKRAERALRQSEEHYHSIFENAVVSLWEEDFSEVRAALEALKHRGIQDFREYLDQHPEFIRDAVKRIKVLDVNDATLKLYGAKSKEELLGPLDKVFTPETLPVIKEELIAIGEGKRYVESETVGKTLGGDRIYILIGLTIPSEKEKFNKMIVSIMDIGDLKRAEETIRKNEDRLLQTQKIEAIGRLAGGIAHDFNNLLTAILGYSEMIKSEASLSSAIQKNVREIERSAERAASLTQQLLAFGRKQMLKPKAIDLNGLVQNIEDMLRRLIGEHISLVADLEPTPCFIKADPVQIEQVIINLAINARDAMPGGGMLSIRVGEAKLSRVDSVLDQEFRPGEYVLLEVSDTGRGMDDETMNHIFEPFFTTKEKGTGLGLSTVYGIVKQSEGYIQFKSEREKGTTFKIYLPQIKSPPEEEPEPKERPQASGGRETILVVEDEDTVRELTCRILKRYGYTIFEAENGNAALELLDRRPPDSINLLITDIVMPRMSGRELAERFLEFFPAGKVLFMSGYLRDTVVRHGNDKDRVAFLQKPFSPHALNRKVREVLESS
jgi:two-component system cell cycle sensor histidine kinase/response regulator CckA